MKHGRRVLALLTALLLLALCACTEKEPASSGPAPTGAPSASEPDDGAYTLSPAVGEHEKIPFGDAKLEQAIRQAMELPEQYDITPAHCRALVYLDIRGLGVSNLDGLQYCYSLEVLYAGHNRISCLAALTGMEDMFILDLSDNRIDDISGITYMKNLMLLDLHGNPLREGPSPQSVFNTDQTYIATEFSAVPWE